MNQILPFCKKVFGQIQDLVRKVKKIIRKGPKEIGPQEIDFYIPDCEEFRRGYETYNERATWTNLF